MSDEPRYQVFVSSTYMDLKRERQVVTAALLECDAFPAGMELFPATDDDAWTLITKVIDESDYYLLVIGGKYGSVDAATEISWTEKEYDYAVSQRKPVMAFLHGDPTSLTVERSETSEAARGKLENFRTKVQRAKHVKYWTDPSSLEGAVALSYNKMTRHNPQIGYIRADRGGSKSDLRELLQARNRIAELEAELLNFKSGSAPLVAEGQELAHGDDEVRIVFSVPVYTRVRVPRLNDESPHWVGQEVSWDNLFAAIGPRLIDESDEQTLSDSICSLMTNDFYEDVVAQVRKNTDVSEEKWKDSGADLGAAILDGEDLAPILLQFKALGFIERSQRNRSLRDKGTYWTLTTIGEVALIRLRAHKRNVDAAEPQKQSQK